MVKNQADTLKTINYELLTMNSKLLYFAAGPNETPAFR